MGLPEDIVTRLKSQGVATTGGVPGSTVYLTSTGWLLAVRDFSPSTVNQQQIAVIESGGFNQEPQEIDRRTFQVLVRGNPLSSTGLAAKVDAVDAALNLYSGTLNGRVYLDIQRQGDRNFIGRDANQRPMYSLNYLTWRSQTT